MKKNFHKIKVNSFSKIVENFLKKSNPLFKSTLEILTDEIKEEINLFNSENEKNLSEEEVLYSDIQISFNSLVRVNHIIQTFYFESLTALMKDIVDILENQTQMEIKNKDEFIKTWKKKLIDINYQYEKILYFEKK